MSASTTAAGIVARAIAARNTRITGPKGAKPSPKRMAAPKVAVSKVASTPAAAKKRASRTKKLANDAPRTEEPVTNDAPRTEEPAEPVSTKNTTRPKRKTDAESVARYLKQKLEREQAREQGKGTQNEFRRLLYLAAKRVGRDIAPEELPKTRKGRLPEVLFISRDTVDECHQAQYEYMRDILSDIVACAELSGATILKPKHVPGNNTVYFIDEAKRRNNNKAQEGETGLP